MSQQLESPPRAPDRSSESHVDDPRDLAARERLEPGRIFRIAAWVPSILVFSALLAIAWYGHRNDWKLPTRSETSSNLVGNTSWCDSHGVPEEECIVCLPGLIEEVPPLTFCKQHGVHGCVLCNPSLAETKQPTKPTSHDIERAHRALMLRPRIENLALSSSPGARIQFASIAAMTKAGVDVEPVERRAVVESIEAAGEIQYDATKSAQVSPRTDGIVRDVKVEVGEWVKAGQLLAMIDSMEAGRWKTELLAALAEERLRQAGVTRLRPLAGQAVAGKRLLESENDLQQATATVNRAAVSLGNLGIQVDLSRLRQMQPGEAYAYVRRLGLGSSATQSVSPDEAPADIRSLSDSMNLIAVITPIAGQIVKLEATLGQVVDRGSELFRVVDTREVWLDLRIAAEEAPLIQLGQAVQFLPDGQRQPHAGNVTWISSDVDPQTRTVRVRAELANVDQNLRNETFGQGRIVLREEPDAIVVPDLALQWDGAGQIVFVRDAKFFDEERPKFFVSRSVRTGARQDGFVEILAGVLPGEVVATNGSGVLKAQLLRSNLGAGCTCGH